MIIGLRLAGFRGSMKVLLNTVQVICLIPTRSCSASSLRFDVLPDLVFLVPSCAWLGTVIAGLPPAAMIAANFGHPPCIPGLPGRS